MGEWESALRTWGSFGSLRGPMIELTPRCSTQPTLPTCHDVLSTLYSFKIGKPSRTPYNLTFRKLVITREKSTCVWKDAPKNKGTGYDHCCRNWGAMFFMFLWCAWNPWNPSGHGHSSYMQHPPCSLRVLGYTHCCLLVSSLKESRVHFTPSRIMAPWLSLNTCSTSSKNEWEADGYS